MAGHKMQDTGYRIQDTGKNIMHCTSRIMHHDNEKGIALVMTLVISAIGLAIMAGLIYMITVGTQISGLQKRYKTALEGGMGGSEFSYEVIGARMTPSFTPPAFSMPALDVGGTNCLNPKLNTSTGTWPVVCSQTVAIDPNVQATYDWRFDLGAAHFQHTGFTQK